MPSPTLCPPEDAAGTEEQPIAPILDLADAVPVAHTDDDEPDLDDEDLDLDDDDEDYGLGEEEDDDFDPSEFDEPEDE